MRAVLQRVTKADVAVDDEVIGAIGPGLVVLLGVGQNDTEADADYLAEKIVNLRIFEDESGKLNRSLLDCGHSMLVVSQFTLWADCRKGRRPSFSWAAPPETADRLYEYFIRKIKQTGVSVATGRFQAMMLVSLVNDGPVTIALDSEKTF